MRNRAVGLLASTIILSGTACPDRDPTSINGNLAAGTWGGQEVGLILDGAGAHVHVGCTKGSFAAPIELDEHGRFSVPGSYLLRAYPVEMGPTLPARLAGVLDGRRLTLTVAVNDTVEGTLVVLGPVSATLGTEPRLGPCPICRTPPRVPGP